MQTPKAPPKNLSPLSVQDDLEWVRIDLAAHLAQQGRYLHWDDVRHRQPPAGMTTQEWWAALKRQRLAARKPVALNDLAGRPFWYSQQIDPVPEHLHLIDRDASPRLAATDLFALPDDGSRHAVDSLIEEAITSSQLEGASTTRLVAADMLRSGRAARDTSERMIVNNFAAMRRIKELCTEPLNKDLVLELHRIVTDGTLADPSAAGRFRTDEERIGVYDNRREELVHQPPPAAELPGRMEGMIRFANGEPKGEFMHPALRAILLHFWLAYDHPFVDGNGRTARALFYWSMQRSGYWLFEYVSISRVLNRKRADYGRAYQLTESDENDLTYFIVHQLGVIGEAMAAFQDWVARKADERAALARRLSAMALLNHRQQALIGHALRHAEQHYTIESHMRSHNVVYQTARTDLLSLEGRGLLKRVKVGRKFVFMGEADSEARLAGG